MLFWQIQQKESWSQHNMMHYIIERGATTIRLLQLTKTFLHSFPHLTLIVKIAAGINEILTRVPLQDTYVLAHKGTDTALNWLVTQRSEIYRYSSYCEFCYYCTNGNCNKPFYSLWACNRGSGAIPMVSNLQHPPADGTYHITNGRVPCHGSWHHSPPQKTCARPLLQTELLDLEDALQKLIVNLLWCKY